MIKEKKIDKDETVACILTGNMLKDTDSMRQFHIEDRFKSQLSNRIRNVADLSMQSIGAHI
ncbi:hypothetical protein [Cohnella luojiensis]|uniref:hypothetical protein n=1 Tax=Cohnella luojiensis TaxID=652876 RepID=UPI00142F8F22|nr:hypothetical protein [Cohnella luojiensis]